MFGSHPFLLCVQVGIESGCGSLRRSDMFQLLVFAGSETFFKLKKGSRVELVIVLQSRSNTRILLSNAQCFLSLDLPRFRNSWPVVWAPQSVSRKTVALR